MSRGSFDGHVGSIILITRTKVGIVIFTAEKDSNKNNAVTCNEYGVPIPSKMADSSEVKKNEA